MFTSTNRRFLSLARAVILAAGAAVSVAAPAAAQVGTTVTYQGRLDVGGQPANGVYDLQFRGFTAGVGGAEIQFSRVCAFDVQVTDGLFSCPVDLGTFLAGQPAWLELRVRADGNNICTEMNAVSPLTPRQALTAAPNANFANVTRGLAVNTANTRNLVIDANGNLAQRAGSDTIPVAIAQSGAAEWLSLRSGSGTERWRLRNGSNGELNFAYNTGSAVEDRVRIGTSAGGALTVLGTTTTHVLTITGGSDIAEPFNIAAPADGLAITPGMVVSIDPTRTGQLRVSDASYDRTVAGIISGANGVNPGLTLTQSGSVADGQHPVALSGRVWVLADADANGSIAAGDLLTSASTPGHAMKVTDHDLAGGSTLGKAMSSLETGKGYVLVLVNLH